MSFWGHRLWHPEIHRKFKDKLVFYRAHARPFSADVIKSQLGAFTAERELRNLTAFVTFGHYDLMMRAWVHSNVTSNLEHGLAGCLGIAVPDPFTVEHEYGAESDKPFVDNADLWRRLNFHRTVRDVQNGLQEDLLRELVDAGWVFSPRDHAADGIRFYVAINVSAPTARPGLGRALWNLLAQNTLLRRPIVYEGRGFCSYLIKAEVDKSAYFSIEKQTEELLDNLKHFDPSTETYLVASELPIHRGEDVVTDSTLIEHRGQTSFIRDMIEEVYESLSPASDDIIKFLHTHEGEIRALANGETQFISEVLRGHLNGQPDHSEMALSLYFSRLERYLSENVPKFANLRQLNYRDLLRAAEVRKDPDSKGDGKHISIGEYLGICVHAARVLNEVANFQLVDPTGFTNLRNKVAHGAYSASEWKSYVAMLVRELPAMRRALDWIASTVKSDPPFKMDFPIRSRK